MIFSDFYYSSFCMRKRFRNSRKTAKITSQTIKIELVAPVGKNGSPMTGTAWLSGWQCHQASPEEGIFPDTSFRMHQAGR